MNKNLKKERKREYGRKYNKMLIRVKSACYQTSIINFSLTENNNKKEDENKKTLK